MSRTIKVGDTPADMEEGRNAGMFCIGVSETGNEVGHSREALAAMSTGEKEALIAKAETRLLKAGADVVLRSVADLPAWISARA
jgi:phosphonoacetaldehyde hydrolase